MITDHPYLPGRGSRLGRCEHVLIVHGSGTESYYCAEPMEKHRDLGGTPPITEAQANSPAARAWEETARQRQGLRFGGGLAQRDNQPRVTAMRDVCIHGRLECVATEQCIKFNSGLCPHPYIGKPPHCGYSSCSFEHPSEWPLPDNTGPMPVQEQEELASNTTFIPVWLDPVRPSYEDLQAENARLRERDSLAITLIGLLRYFLDDHEAAGRDYRPYRDWKALDDN